MKEKTTADEKTLMAIHAKVAAKKRWHAIQPQGESSSPVCYLDDGPAVPDLETYMNVAAMKVLSGLSCQQLEALKVDQPQRYGDLLEQAWAVPYVYSETKDGR